MLLFFAGGSRKKSYEVSKFGGGGVYALNEFLKKFTRGGGQKIFLKHPSSDFLMRVPPPPTPLSHSRVTTISTEITMNT